MASTGKKNITQKQPPINPPARQNKNKYFIPAIIFLLCLLLYGNTLQNGYVGDDNLYTYKNDLVTKGFSSFTDIFTKASLYGFDKRNNGSYRPLTLLNFMIETSFFGLNPHVSHFFNILFFALTAVLLYFFLQKVLKNYNRAIIIAATLLFAFHPIHTEVVANIKSRDEILGLLFGLISFYFLLLHEEKKGIHWYFISIAAFSAALLCKESCLTFIAIIPLLLYFFTGLEIKKVFLKSIPYIGAICFYMFIRSRILQHITFAHQITVMQNVLMSAENSAVRTATRFVLLGKYIYMLFVPYPLSCDYSYNQIPIVSWGNIKPVLSLLVCAGMAGFMLWGLKRKSVFSFLIAFFFVTISLSCSFIIIIACTFGERFLYTPSLSFCIALPILTAKALKLEPAQPVWKNKIKFYIPVICLLIIYTIIVIPRNLQWKSKLAVVTSCVITSPNSALALDALANIYMDTAQYSKNPAKRLQYDSLSLQEFKKAIKIYPMEPDWYYYLGIAYHIEGNRDSAILSLKKALELRPDYPSASDYTGFIYFNNHQYDSALFYFFMSYKTNPNDLDALRIIGECYQNEKNYPLAFHYDSLVLKNVPNDKQTFRNLSVLHVHLGVQYVSNNELDNALKEFYTALHYDSISVNILHNIGVVYQKKGDMEKARLFYRKALSKDPNDKASAINLQLLNGKQ